MKKARRRTTRKAYIGDKVLALVEMLGSCLAIGLLAALAAASAGAAVLPEAQEAMQKSFTGIDWTNRSVRDLAIWIAIGAGLLAVFNIWLLVSLWKSRRWSLWFMLITSAISTALSTGFNEWDVQSTFTAAIAVYCFLRLAGALGPKPMS